jgi:galactokinase/mevalonate kinase-like predicted kinase
MREANSIILHEGVQTISDYIMGHSFALADKKDGAWAHKNCVKHHVCNNHQHEAYEIMYKKWGQDAIILPEGVGGEMIVKVDPTVNDQ